MKSRSKIALFSIERYFEIWFPQKKTITYFRRKVSKLQKKDTIFACDIYNFPKTKGKQEQAVDPFGCP